MLMILRILRDYAVIMQ